MEWCGRLPDSSDRVTGRLLDPSGKVVAVEVHHLVPHGSEVLHKTLLRVVGSVDFRDRPELRVRTEDQVNPGTGPLDFAGGTIAPLEHTIGGRGCLPLGVHVEEVDEVV